jgi:hypothetical protein
MSKQEHLYEIGQRVMWSGTWGTEPPKPATVISLTDKRGKLVYILDNDHWAYEYQLQTIWEEYEERMWIKAYIKGEAA